MPLINKIQRIEFKQLMGNTSKTLDVNLYNLFSLFRCEELNSCSLSKVLDIFPIHCFHSPWFGPALYVSLTFFYALKKNFVIIIFIITYVQEGSH